MRSSAPGGRRIPFVLSSPHSGSYYPAELQSLSRLDEHMLRLSEDSYVDEIFGGAAALGAPLLKAVYSRAYVDAEPRAVRARSRHVRRSPAGSCQQPVGAGRDRLRHGRAGSRARHRDLSRQAQICRGPEAHRADLFPLSPGARNPARGNPRPVRPSGADRLPFHAVERLRGARIERASRTSCSATASARAAAGALADRRRPCCARWATGWCAIIPMPAASSPSNTAGPPTASMRCRSRSTAADLYGRAHARPARPAFDRLARDMTTLIAQAGRSQSQVEIPRQDGTTAGSPRSPSKPTAFPGLSGWPGLDFGRKKSHSAWRNGSSLGRKRPRRATGPAGTSRPRRPNMRGACRKINDNFIHRRCNTS